ncbi:MAG: hypothetical protein ACKN9V_01065 [Pseudomonadota bacterium]
MYKLVMTMESSFYALRSFFERPVCQRAADPLKDGAELAIQVGTESPFSLSKHQGQLSLNPTPPTSPDITFLLGAEIPSLMSQLTSNEMAELGISIFNWMLEKDQNKRISARVHIDSFSILRKGYLGVLAQGGIPVMQYLATKGMGNLSKIKEVLSKLRS